MSIPGSASPLFIGAAAADAAAFQIDRSLRFNDDDGAKLTRTFVAGNQSKWTWSGWVKRSSLGTKHHLFAIHTADNNSGYFRLAFNADNTLFVGLWSKSALTTDAVYRDLSAWMHIVLVLDLGNSTAADKIILYVNGVRQSVTLNVGTDQNYAINSAGLHNIGSQTSTSQHFDGYMAEVHFVDGQALAATDFGEYDNNNVWQPKEYTGAYTFPAIQTVVWSNNLTADGGGSLSGTTSNGFNGDEDDYVDSSDGATLDLTGHSFGTGSHYIRLKTGGATSVTVNGTSLTDPGGGGAKVWYGTITGELTTLSVVGGASIYFITVDGKYLIDQGLTLPSTNSFYLKFADNSSNAALGTDSSGNSNTWTVNNLTAAYNFGLTKAAQIVGTSKTFSFPITYTTTLTYEFFVRITTDGTYNYMAKMTGDQWNLGTSGSSLLFGNYNGGWTTFSSTGLNDSEWHFVRLTTTGSSTSLYVDGSLIATNSSGGSVSTGSEVTNQIRGTGSGAFEIAHLRITTGGTPPTTGVPDISTMNAAAGSGGTLAFYDKLDDIASSGTKTSDGGNVTITMSAATVGVTDPNADSLIDTPTNYTASSGNNNGGNYCTMNPLKSRLTLSNGNLDSTSPGDWKGAAGTIGMSSGKYYWEIDNVVSNEHVVGIVKYNTPNVTWNTTYGYGAETGVKYLATGGVSYGAAWTTGDVIGVAFDADNGNLEFYKNGTSQGVAATGLTDGPYLPSMVHNGSSRSASINFGQRPWHYSPKADHVALCTTNLPDPTIADGSTAFDTKLYTGNGSSYGNSQTISGLSFSPDFLWIKCRSNSSDHHLADTVNGINKNLESNSTIGNQTNNNNGYISATTSDGFTVVYGGIDGLQTNDNSKTYVAWAWDAGASTASNTDGSITTNVRASQTNGFSIATYTGNGSANQTLGHGLNAAPAFVLIKDRSSSQNWAVLHTSAGTLGTLDGGTNYKLLELSSTDGARDASYNTIWHPTNTTVKIGEGASSAHWTNKSGDNYVMYAWTPVEGYSAFGSYEGTASSNFTDPFVYTGFRPRWLLLKESSASGELWVIYDSARNTSNVMGKQLYPSSNVAEADASADTHARIDFLSNGFKIRGSHSSINTNGQTIVFAAFAEHSFKTARAR